MASLILERARPQILILAGIAGGFPERGVHRGDVVIAHTVHSFDYGKLTKGAFRRRPELDFNCDVSLLQYASTLVAEKVQSWRRYVGLTRPDRRTAEKTSAHTDCYIASSNKVVDDPGHPFYSAVASTFSEVHAVEMEAVGAAAATRLNQSDRVVRFLMIRGISDEPGTLAAAGSAQRSKWKKYASEVAAAFTRRLIERVARTMPKVVETSKPRSTSGQFSHHLFQTVGALPGNAPSYVWRRSDDDLVAALQRQAALICISGEYGIGKSSALIRAREYLLDRTVCLMDCQGMSTHSAELFVNEIFYQIREQFPGADSWKSLIEKAGTFRPLLVFDEFGAIAKLTLSAIMSKLNYLVSNGIPVIICAPDPLKELRDAGINPKYFATAKSVSVNPLDSTESLQPILELLPKTVQALARAESARILRNSQGRPQAVQRLCERLSALATLPKVKLRGDEVERIVADPKSYVHGKSL
jgi:nucleoside phosphorylase